MLRSSLQIKIPFLESQKATGGFLLPVASQENN
jgi:hypothetical protein